MVTDCINLLGHFACSQCGFSLTVENVKGRINEPTKCPRPDCQMTGTMLLVHNRCIFSDKQIIRLQETPENIPTGQTPHSITLCVYDSLVDELRPGDK